MSSTAEPAGGRLSRLTTWVQGWTWVLAGTWVLAAVVAIAAPFGAFFINRVTTPGNGVSVNSYVINGWGRVATLGRSGANYHSARYGILLVVIAMMLISTAVAWFIPTGRSRSRLIGLLASQGLVATTGLIAIAVPAWQSHGNGFPSRYVYVEGTGFWLAVVAGSVGLVAAGVGAASAVRSGEWDSQRALAMVWTLRAVSLVVSVSSLAVPFLPLYRTTHDWPGVFTFDTDSLSVDGWGRIHANFEGALPGRHDPRLGVLLAVGSIMVMLGVLLSRGRGRVQASGLALSTGGHVTVIVAAAGALVQADSWQSQLARGAYNMPTTLQAGTWLLIGVASLSVAWVVLAHWPLFAPTPVAHAPADVDEEFDTAKPIDVDETPEPTGSLDSAGDGRPMAEDPDTVMF